MTEQQYNNLLNNNPSLKEMFQPTINNLDTIKFIECILGQTERELTKTLKTF